MAPTPHHNPAINPTRTNREAGFSLIETLVVIAIMATAATLIFLTSPSGTPSLEKEADRLAAQLMAKRDFALIQNRPVLIDITADGYETRVRTRTGWAEPNGKRDYIDWEDGTSIQLPGDRLPGALMFDTIGLTEPTSITLYRDGRTETIDLDGSGNVSRRGGNS